jgi:hypothetical protein
VLPVKLSRSSPQTVEASLRVLSFITRHRGLVIDFSIAKSETCRSRALRLLPLSLTSTGPVGTSEALLDAPVTFGLRPTTPQLESATFEAGANAALCDARSFENAIRRCSRLSIVVTGTLHTQLLTGFARRGRTIAFDLERSTKILKAPQPDPRAHLPGSAKCTSSWCCQCLSVVSKRVNETDEQVWKTLVWDLNCHQP